jgi:hypothetical protein
MDRDDAAAIIHRSTRQLEVKTVARRAAMAAGVVWTLLLSSAAW